MPSADQNARCTTKLVSRRSERAWESPAEVSGLPEGPRRAAGAAGGATESCRKGAGELPERRRSSRSPRGTVSGMASAPSLLVTEDANGKFVVKITDGKLETSHVVSVPSGFGPELGLGGVSDEDLVRVSFRFLLDREPATSILARFSLDLISRYFPEYPREIGKYI